ncbi:MAG: hypothetical protein KF762_10850 [Acidobacteria bacterium]|nr:hypothetical protein [Acidobacteriota bacterium]
MKRWAIGYIAFLAALLVGSLAAYFLNINNVALSETGASGGPSLAVDNSSEEKPQLNSGESKDDYVEYFADDKRIGRQRKNKVEMRCIGRGSNKTADIDFLSRTKDGSWIIRQSFKLTRDNLMDCSPEIKDFNNDGFGDLTFVSSTAARGANELRTLLIYDHSKDELVHIKNSAEYPNLEYNKKLDCLDSWMFHGSTSTVFLRLEGDELREFASVDTGAELTVRILRRDRWVETYRRKMSLDDVYTRYSTYDPPRP